MPKPSIFIGSSVEGLPVARAVQAELQHDFDITVWNQQQFLPSHAIFDSLLDAARKFEFGLFVFSPDDLVTLRGSEWLAVRDNVLFECGLFFGTLGKDGSFFLAPRGIDNFHLPTDLSGIKSLSYDPNGHGGKLQAVVGPACNELRNALESLLTTVDRRRSLSGEWTQIWNVRSKNYDPKNESQSTVWHIGDRFIATCADRTHSFRIQARVKGNFVTGTWGDETSRLYYFGALQLYVSPSGDRMEGKWLGYKSNNTIATGNWTWLRKDG